MIGEGNVTKDIHSSCRLNPKHVFLMTSSIGGIPETASKATKGDKNGFKNL